MGIDLAAIPLVQARNYRKGGNLPPGRIVLHDMEAPEALTTAENVAAYFAGKNAPMASTHYSVDGDSIVRSVKDEDTAYHAPPNARSLGVEHAGYASQRRDQWLDPYSTAELHLSAQLVRALCDKYAIPIRYVDAAGLLRGEKGITTHAQVSAAWHQSDHSDPGPGFPMDVYLALVADPDPHPATGGTPVAANAPFATLLVHPPTGGYLEIGEDGGVFNFGGAPFFGSLANIKLNQPIIDAAWTPDFGGYYLIGRDGGVFAFGNAHHQGNALWAG